MEPRPNRQTTHRYYATGGVQPLMQSHI